MRLRGIEKTSVWRTLLLVVGLMAATVGPLWANPSSLAYEGSSIVWSVGEKRIWRFPDAFAAEVEEMSDRFKAGSSNDSSRADNTLCTSQCLFACSLQNGFDQHKHP